MASTPPITEQEVQQSAGQSSGQARSSVAPSIWSIALPTIGIMLLSTISGVVLIRIVADLGPVAIVIASAGQRLALIWSSLFLGLGAATTAIVSRSWGAGRRDEAAAYARFLMRAGFLVSCCMSAATLFAADYLPSYFDLPPSAFLEARSYFRWLALLPVIQVVLMVANTALRATGDARTPLAVGTAGNVVGLIAAYLLTYGAFGMPGLGVVGASIGWAVGFGLSVIFYGVLRQLGKLAIDFANPSKQASIDRSRIWRIALPATIEPFVVHSSFFAFMWAVARYGTPAFAAYGVGINLMIVPQTIGYGFSIATATVVGQKLGAGTLGSARAETYRALWPALIAMGGLGALVVAFPHAAAGLMVEDPVVANLLANFLTVIGLCQVLEAFDQVLSGAMRGAGDTRYPLKVNVVSATLVRLPLAAAVMLGGLSVAWLYAIVAVELAVKSVMLWKHFLSGRWVRNDW